MEHQTLVTLALSIAGALILLLLAIIGYWLQKWITSTDALTEAITNLKVLFATTQSTVDNIEKNCAARCKVYDERLGNHSEFIHEHETAIALLEAKPKKKPKPKTQTHVS